MSYAENTSVPVERTRMEIEALLTKSGATGFMSAWDNDKGVAQIMCRLASRMLRFMVEVPTTKEFLKTPKGRKRNPPDAKKAAEQEHRRRWRAQLLIIKAKLEMIHSGLSSVEREFLADILLPDGGTVSDHILPKIAEAYNTGEVPLLLPSGG